VQEKRPDPKPYDHIDDVFYYGNAASGTEMTGLIAHAPLTEEEYASYGDIYEFDAPTDSYPRIYDDKSDDGPGPFFGSDHTDKTDKTKL